MTPEAKIKALVVSVLKKYGAYYFYPVTGGYGRSGAFDIVVVMCGIFIGIECKAPGKKPTKLQSKNARDAEKSGAIIFLIDGTNTETLREVLEDIYEQKENYRGRRCFWPVDC